MGGKVDKIRNISKLLAVTKGKFLIITSYAVMKSYCNIYETHDGTRQKKRNSSTLCAEKLLEENKFSDALLVSFKPALGTRVE